jgi:hypothetical protein
MYIWCTKEKKFVLYYGKKAIDTRIFNNATENPEKMKKYLDNVQNLFKVEEYRDNNSDNVQNLCKVEEYRNYNLHEEAKLLGFISSSEELCGCDLYTLFSTAQFSTLQEETLKKELKQKMNTMKTILQETDQKVYKTDYRIHCKTISSNKIVTLGCGPRKGIILNILLDFFDNAWLVHEISEFLVWDKDVNVTHVYQFVFQKFNNKKKEAGRIYAQGVEGKTYFLFDIATRQSYRDLKGKLKK